MKRIFLIAALLICTNVFADNSIRINELKEEGKNLVSQRQQLMQQIQNMELRVSEINGALKELVAQDEKSKPKTEPKKAA